MAQNTTIGLDADTWTQITDGDVTSITFQNRGPGDVLVTVTATASAPSDTAGAIRYQPNQGEVAIPLSELQPGVSSGARVYAYAEGNHADVFVSNA